MAVVDPYVSLSDWQSSLYRGAPAVVDTFLNTIDASLPPGWVRDLEYERARLRPDRIRCYLYDQAGDAALRLWLKQVTATRVRGGPIEVLRRPPSDDGVRFAQLIAEFSDRCVLPAAKTAGARSTRPAFSVRSALTGAAETLFTRFADLADGEWPLTDPTKELWDELIWGCQPESIAIHREDLARWFADNGWQQEAATALTDRFYADSAWLDRRLAAMTS